MKKHYAILAGLLVMAFILGACATATPEATAVPEPTEEPMEPFRVGVVTDVGQLEDKSFNQSSWEGAQAGADAVGGEADVIVTQDISDYKANIQTFVDQGFDAIVTVGFLIGTDTIIAANENPDVKFIGVDQFICVDTDGNPDATFACEGDAAALLPNYQGVLFTEAQAGYLAGIVAASISETGTIGAVAGTNVPAVVAYIAGYGAGAQSVNPDVVVLSQETDPNPAIGFNDPAKGKAIAQQFIAEGADVLFQVAGLTGQGVLEAACDAEIYGIGVDVDQVETLPTLAGCIVTSAEKKLFDTVSAVVESAAGANFQGGNVFYSAASSPPAIGLSPYHEFEGLITPETQALLDEAMAAMASGELVPPSE